MAYSDSRGAFRAIVMGTVAMAIVVTAAAVFFTLAFAGTGLPWVTWGLGDYVVKLGMVLLLLLPFRVLLDATRPTLELAEDS